MSELQLKNVHAAYKKKEVLRGISLSLNKGEILALIGPNGAGKSTLLKVISGFLTPIEGCVLINNKDMTYLPTHERVREGLAYCMQGGRIFPSLSVVENLEMGASLLSHSERKNSISTVLSLFPELKGLLNKRAGLLSGGERQYLALAIVFIRQPHLLLIDEPSVGLSPKLVQNMVGKIYELNSRWSTTIVLIEQNVSEALKIAHRAILLTNGQVSLETNQPKEWLNSSQIDHLFLGQQHVVPKE